MASSSPDPGPGVTPGSPQGGKSVTKRPRRASDRELHVKRGNLVKICGPEDLCRILHRREGDPRTAAVDVAANQLGVVSRVQLLALGLSSRMIDWRLRRDVLHWMYQGVYLLGHPVAAPGAHEVAAILACGPDALISHRSAAAWWGFAPAYPGEVEVIVASSRSDSRQGLRVHRTRSLPDPDRRVHRGLPITSPTRTLLDLALDGYPALERAVAEAQVAKLITAGQLAAAIAAHRAQPGTAQLRTLAGDDLRGFTRSEAERRLRTLCRNAHLPGPQANIHLHGWEVDLLWPAQRLVVETDGFAAHGHRAAFERDRRKQAELVAHGYRVIRLTWRQLCEEPLAVVAILAGALSARSLAHPGSVVGSH